MKKGIFITDSIASLGIVSLCIALVSACSTDLQIPEKTKRINILVSSQENTIQDGKNVQESASAKTKALYIDREGMEWESTDGEKLGLVTLSGESSSTWTSSHSSAISISADKSAKFNATIPADASTLYFVYPYELSSDADGVHTFSFPSSLTQARAGSCENLKFYSEGVPFSEDMSEVSPNLKMAGALVRTVLYSAKGSKESVTSVNLATKSEGANISSTQYALNLAEGTFSGGGTTSKNVQVKLLENYPLASHTQENNSSAVYLPILPVTTEGFTFTVYTDAGASYTFDSAKSKSWEQGHLYTFLLNLDKATRSLKITPRFAVWTGWGTSETCTISRSVGASEGSTYSDSWFIKFNDIVATKAQSEWIRIESTADWLSASATEDGKFKIDYTANSTSAERSADINIFFDSPFGSDGVSLDLWGNDWFAMGSLQILHIKVTQSAQ